MQSHKHKVRINHKWEAITVPQEYKAIHNEQRTIQQQNPTIPREKMELFAVVCIQTSHYVSFVKCGKGKDAQWIFFDSMADRMGKFGFIFNTKVMHCIIRFFEEWFEFNNYHFYIPVYYLIQRIGTHNLIFFL